MSLKNVDGVGLHWHFCLVLAIQKKEASKWNLLNFVVGQAKFSIYKSRVSVLLIDE